MAKRSGAGKIDRFLGRLTEPELAHVHHWLTYRPHAGQQAPEGDWRVWLILAGRGFGKTRAGAEWVSELARKDGSRRFALVGATLDEVANVMVRGESGLMAVARWDETVVWVPSRRTVLFGNGAEAYAYSAERPDKLRGPEHHYAWCDELAKWAYPEATWDNLQLGLRLGSRRRAEPPQVAVTTTPRPIALVKRLAADRRTVQSNGRTWDNPHLPPAFVEGVVERYGRSRLGRQELEGEIVEEVAGALWTRALVERCRVLRDTAPGSAAPHGEQFVRIVIGVDPPVSAAGDACGIVAVGLGADGVGLVLGDHSVAGLSPDGWVRGGGGRGAWRRPGGRRSQPRG